MSKFQTLEKDTHISIFEGLSLSDYADARSYVCKPRHKQPCQLCLSMIKVAQKILHEGFLKLKDAFTMTSPGVSYTSLHARRKLLQMPLVSIGVGDKKNGNYCVYLVEKQSTVHYKVLRSLLNSLIQSQSGQKPVNLSKETVNSLLKLAESDAEKLRLKYAIVKATGLSSSKAKNVNDFSDMSSKVSRVENALEEATYIREAIENIAKVKTRRLPVLLVSMSPQPKVVALTAAKLTVTALKTNTEYQVKLEH